MAPESSLPSGTLIGGRFEILRLRGRGGMGSVYEAEDRTLSRPVALKLLSVSSHEAQARFATEAHAASRISSRYAAGVFDFGQDPDHGHYMVMELLDGTSLDDMLDERSLSPSEATAVGADIAEALHAAHLAGVVHRDLKPGNVMLLDAGGVKVVDFGIARVMEPRGTHQPFKTKPDVIIGTPAYMSPEAVRGDEVGPASDLYSLGVLLFEMVTGELPFFDPVQISILTMHLNQVPPRVSEVYPEAGLPDGFEALVAALLEKDAALRPRSAAEVASTLRGMSSVDGPIRLAADKGPGVGAATAVIENPENRSATSSGWKWGVALGAAALGLLIAAVALLVLRLGEPEIVAQSLPPLEDRAELELPGAQATSQPGLDETTSFVPAEPSDDLAEPTEVRLSVTVVPPGARVTLDGDPAESEMRITPGQPHVVEARAPGYRTERRVVQVDHDESVTIALQRAARTRGQRRAPALPTKMHEW